MAETESEEAVQLQNKVSEMSKSTSSIALPFKLRSTRKFSKQLPLLLTKDKGLLKMVSSREPESSYFLTKNLAEMLNEDSISLQNQSCVIHEEPKSSYFLTKSLAEMVNEDPIRLQNQSCVIREEIVKTVHGEQLVYSSLAHLPTFSIGLSSTKDEAPPRAPSHESSVDPKDKSPHRYFQMPELGARVFVGDVDGIDTITCHLLYVYYEASKSDLDSEYATVRSLYKNDCPGGLSGWLQAQPVKFWSPSENYSNMILSGTELFVDSPDFVYYTPMVGNLGGKSSSASASSSDYKDCIGDETIRQPLDIVEPPRAHVPGASYFWADGWTSFEGPYLHRSTEGSYLEKPKFMKWRNRSSKHFPLRGGILQLTRFDDFVILGNIHEFLDAHKVRDIVRENASKSTDVIATQLVKEAMEANSQGFRYPITAIVIFLDHKEILLREHRKAKKENMATKYKVKLLGLKETSLSRVLKNDKKIVKLKEEEKIITLKEEENIFASKREDKKEIMMEEDYKVKILVGEPLLNIAETSTVSLEENEVGMKSATINSNLLSATVQDDSEVSSSIALIEEDDCKSEDFMVSRHITKWIIYGDLDGVKLERNLLCFLNIEEMQYEFYFEDHESMASIIGLGVPSSKVVLECGSLHVIVVEIPEEDWDVVWAHSNVIPLSIPKGNVLKQEQFPDILHHIANIINIDNIISKANNGGIGGDNGKDKIQDNTYDSKGKAHDHDDHGNTGHPGGGSNGAPNDNDNKERKKKDGNDEKKESRDQNDGKIFNDCKEVQAVVHLRLLPGGVLEDKGKKKEFAEGYEEEGKKNELGEIHEEEIEEKKKGEGKKKALWKIHEEDVEEKKKELGEVYEEVEEEKKKELGKGCKGVEKKKKKYLKTLWNALAGGENGNVVGNHQKLPITDGVENVEVDVNLEKELVKQIHSHMVFTFTIKDEGANLPLKTIQATIHPVTFQMPPNNEENYLQRRRFGWFHEKLQVAFGVVNTEVADLEPNSWKVLNSYEAKEVNLQGNSKGNARSSTNAYKGKMGIKHCVIAIGEYDRTNGSETKTTDEVYNSWETNKTLTEGGFSILPQTDLNTHQVKYSYRPSFPFDEKEFEVKDEGGRLKMYEYPICRLQRVSFEGTWQPYDSEKLEAYKLEASRELRMTKIYNLDLETTEEKQQKRVQDLGKNQPLCFIQKLDKVVYLNHAMSHLTSSTTRVYRLKEQQDLSDPSTTFVTQAQNKREPEWPSNDPLVDVKQKRNI